MFFKSSTQWDVLLFEQTVFPNLIRGCSQFITFHFRCSFLLTLFPYSSVWCLPKDTVLHELLQHKSIPQVAVLQEPLQHQFFAWRRVLQEQTAPDRTRGNDFKVKEGRFRPDMRKNFFYNEGGKILDSLPRDVVDVLSLEIFKARLE